MEGIAINPDIDLSILSQEGFSKRFSKLTGELSFLCRQGIIKIKEEEGVN